MPLRSTSSGRSRPSTVVTAWRCEATMSPIVSTSVPSRSNSTVLQRGRATAGWYRALARRPIMGTDVDVREHGGARPHPDGPADLLVGAGGGAGAAGGAAWRSRSCWCWAASGCCARAGCAAGRRGSRRPRPRPRGCSRCGATGARWPTRRGDILRRDDDRLASALTARAGSRPVGGRPAARRARPAGRDRRVAAVPATCAARRRRRPFDRVRVAQALLREHDLGEPNADDGRRQRRRLRRRTPGPRRSDRIRRRRSLRTCAASHER